MIIPSDEPIALQDQLAQQIADKMCATGLDPARAAAVAQAVAIYCLEEAPLPRVASGALSLLTAKALSSLGEDAAADRILAAEPPLHALAGLVSPTRVSPLLMSLIDAGVVRPLRWPAMTPGLTVVLDLRQIRRDDSCLLELAYVQSMQRLVDACAELWAGVGGEGVLALRGLQTHAANRAVTGGTEMAATLRAELVLAVRERLAQMTAARSWLRTPRVIELD